MSFLIITNRPDSEVIQHLCDEFSKVGCAVCVMDNVTSLTIARGEFDHFERDYSIIVDDAIPEDVLKELKPKLKRGFNMVSQLEKEGLSRIFATSAEGSQFIKICQGTHTLVVDLSDRSGCTVNDKPIILTTNEYLVLRALAYGANSVVSYNALKDAGWPKKETVCDRLLAVVMTNLRRETDPIQISTLRSQGYRLDTDDQEPLLILERDGVAIYKSGRITNHGNPVSLSNSEALILRALMTSQGDITLKLLHDKLYADRDSATRPSINSISSFLSRIKEKLAQAYQPLDAPLGLSFIRTYHNGRVRWQSGEPIKPEAELDSINIIVNGRLKIDIKNRILTNINTGQVKDIGYNMAKVLQYMFEKPSRTGVKISEELGLTEELSSAIIQKFRTFIRRLNIEPDDIIHSGKGGHNSSGYRLINAVLEAPEPDSANSPVGEDMHAVPAAE